MCLELQNIQIPGPSCFLDSTVRQWLLGRIRFNSIPTSLAPSLAHQEFKFELSHVKTIKTTVRPVTTD